jgi:hypothetical protein
MGIDMMRVILFAYKSAPLPQKSNGNTYDLDKAARFFQDLASPNKSGAGYGQESLLPELSSSLQLTRLKAGRANCIGKHKKGKQV